MPKVGGGAVAVIGGSAPGLLDAQTGSFVPILEEALFAIGNERRTPEVWLGLDWIALQDGSVRGWTPHGGVGIKSDGRLEPSVYFFSQVAGAGAHALASDGRHLFQSSDWGRSWVETLAPPGFVSDGKLNGSAALLCGGLSARPMAARRLGGRDSCGPSAYAAGRRSTSKDEA